MDLSKQAVLRTILYADLFDFPLTEEELWQYSISSQKISQAHLNQALQFLIQRKVLTKKDGYIALFENDQIINNRIKNKKYIDVKKEIAKNAASILFQIPSVYLVGISGSLAAHDVKEADDIDLFIISDFRYMWVTRALSIFLLSKHRIRRTRGNPEERNKICLNMFISSKYLTFPKNRQDVYTAREIVQLIPLFERENMYDLFLKENAWITSFLPHATKQKHNITTRTENGSSGFENWYRFPMVQLVEIFQKLYMIPHKTTEDVTNSVFAFHPHDYRYDILRKYRQKLKKYSITDL